jgi:hypothetical protein
VGRAAPKQSARRKSWHRIPLHPEQTMKRPHALSLVGFVTVTIAIIFASLVATQPIANGATPASAPAAMTTPF